MGSQVRQEKKSLHDPSAFGALVLARPPRNNIEYKGKGEVVDVVVDPYLAQHLRPHQREGVQFLYECVMGYVLLEARIALPPSHPSHGMRRL